MSEQPYKRPPITESVIEVRFASPLGTDNLADINRKFRQFYPNEQIVSSVKVEVNFSDTHGSNTKPKISEEGFRRSSNDMTQILILNSNSILVSQLAPYPGWDTFCARFTRDWKVLKRAQGFREIKRIGVRYINRIDIPISGPYLKYTDYLNLHPRIPDNTILGPIAEYAMQVALPIQGTNCKVLLNSALVPSPLLEHLSILVDQDISIDESPPQKDEAIFELLGIIREKKNAIFEACLTDRTRELFQKER